MDGEIEIDPLITTHTMPLENIDKALAPMHSGERIRSVTVF